MGQARPLIGRVATKLELGPNHSHISRHARPPFNGPAAPVIQSAPTVSAAKTFYLIRFAYPTSAAANNVIVMICMRLQMPSHWRCIGTVERQGRILSDGPIIRCTD
jgi:hypothetical protein